MTSIVFFISFIKRPDILYVCGQWLTQTLLYEISYNFCVNTNYNIEIKHRSLTIAVSTVQPCQICGFKQREHVTAINL